MPFMIIGAVVAIVGAVVGNVGAKKAAKQQNKVNMMNYEREKMNADAEKEINNILAHTNDRWEGFTADLYNKRRLKAGESEYNAMLDNIGRVGKEMTKNDVQGALVASEQLGQLIGHASFVGMADSSQKQASNTLKLQQLSSQQDVREQFNDQLSDMQVSASNAMANAIRELNGSPILSNNQVASRSVAIPTKVTGGKGWGELALNNLGSILKIAGGVSGSSTATITDGQQVLTGQQQLPSMAYDHNNNNGIFSFFRRK